MRSLLRRLRASLVVALPFAAYWGITGLLLGSGRAIRYVRDYGADLGDSWGYLLTQAARGGATYAALGTLGGLLFAALLASRERGRTVHALSPRRLGIWGALVGAVVVGVVDLAGRLGFGAPPPKPVEALLVTAALGLGSGLLVFAIARRTSKWRAPYDASAAERVRERGASSLASDGPAGSLDAPAAAHGATVHRNGLVIRELGRRR